MKAVCMAVEIIADIIVSVDHYLTEEWYIDGSKDTPYSNTDPQLLLHWM